ncbi:MAG: type I-E CRISPR-associated protein Cas6/Cse3/CasE [Alphaproteobacteria bacterium]|nr:type I-E CRISPR-associated protein Cas6/Cse3/CasE [Alphaproteobacteria bacterium]
MSELHLVRLPVRQRSFTEWALGCGYLATPPGDGKGKPRDADPGYALHALLAGLFGEEAPRPFAPPPLGARESRAGSQQLELWGYTRRPLEDLREVAKLADDRLAALVDLAEARSKPMPARWPEGVRLAFELRACPVKRLMQPLTVREGVAGWETTLARGAEIDAYQVAVARRETGTPEPDRSAVYCDWLAERLPPTAAHLRPESLRVDAYRSTRLLRRPRTPDGKRGAQWLTRPDVHFSGTLEVADGEAFARLLASGVGRHCGFGFGMLLLKPA